MASITINISDGNIGEVRDALCDYGGRTAQVPDPANPGSTIPNPIGKAQFATDMLKSITRDILRQYRQKAAAAAAGDATPRAVDL
jgi:hypothetical protein